MDTTRVCETCGSENVRTAGDGGMGFCEDCDAPCTTAEAYFYDEERDDPRADLYAIQ